MESTTIHPHDHFPHIAVTFVEDYAHHVAIREVAIDGGIIGVPQEHDLPQNELNVLALAAAGLTHKAMAGIVRRSQPTVHFYVNRLLDDMGVSVMAEAVSQAMHPDIHALSVRQFTADTPQLPARRLDVVSGIAMGLSNRQIHRQFQMAEPTVKTHYNRLPRDGIRLPNRNAIAAYAFIAGLVAWQRPDPDSPYRLVTIAAGT